MIALKPVLRIGLDATPLAEPWPTGVAAAIRGLLDAIARQDDTQRYYVCYRLSRLKRAPALYRPQRPNFRLKLLQEPFHPFFSRRLHLFHGMDTRLPRFPRVPAVATIHDLACLQGGVMATGERFRARRSAQYEQAVECAARVIVYSEAVAGELSSRFGLHRDRIRVVPLAPDARFRPVSRGEERRVRERYGLIGRYLLFVGRASPRKNLLRLVEGFAAAQDALEEPLELVLVGGGESAAVLGRAAELGVAQRVRSFAHLPGEDLPALYCGALALAYLPLYEGFGLPLLEAMACGVPVLAARIPALMETARDAALLVDPLDVPAIKEAVQALSERSALRHRLATAGRERVRRFDWEKSARETLRVYQEVLQEARGVAAGHAPRRIR